MSKISKGSGRGLLLLALLFAVVAAVLAIVAISRSGNGNSSSNVSGSTSSGQTQKVVVASQDIAARTTLDAGMLKVADVPQDNVLANGYTSTDAVVGQITRYPLSANEQITALKLGVTSDVSNEGLSSVLPVGTRAFSITVSEESGAGGMILPGDLVDVIAILKSDLVGIDKAVTLMQGIEVLSVAQKAQEPIPPQATGTATPVASGTLGERPSDAKANPSAHTVTLAVTQEQAQLLALAQASGTLALSLRSYGDKATVTPGETDLRPYGAVAKTPSP
jgi:Flp pilus assembly protein CpaB